MVSYDSEGRLCYEGSMNIGFSSHKLTVPSNEQLKNWKSDCKRAFQLKECEDGERYSVGQTFWIGADTPPRCELERLAKEVFALHTKDASYDPATSGAEWWTQHIDTIDDIGFHFDRDYGLEEEGELCHPLLGTVTYLSTVGGATIVLDMPGCHYRTTQSGEIDCPVEKVIISKPEVGKHITFDGLMLHGAPADLYEEGSEDQSDDEDEDEDDYESESEGNGNPRVTFLVNIWLNHVPTQAAPLHADLASLMQPPLSRFAAESSGSGGDGSACSTFFQPCPSSSVKSVSVREEWAESEIHATNWSVELEDQTCVISVALPPASALEGCFQDGVHSVVVRQGDEGASVRSSAVHCSSSSSADSGGVDRQLSREHDSGVHAHKKHRTA